MANDFSSDPNCVALWKLDANVQDSKGGNHLTAVNSPSYDSSDKKEGSYCIDLEKDSSQYAYITDANLASGFPAKSGTSEQSFSVCFWMKAESLSGYYPGLVGKWYAASNQRSFWTSIGASYKLYFIIGYNSGASSTSLTFGTGFTSGRWYHVAVVYDASTNGMKIRIWDDYNSALLGSNATGTASGDMSPTASQLEIGRIDSDNSRCFDGKIDEVVIFKKVLTDAEIDAIRAGTYSGGVTEKTSSDTGSGADTVVSLETWEAKTAADSGSGADAVDSLQTPQVKTSSDAGSGAEGTPSQNAILAGGESGSGLEALIARLLSGEESGGAVEAADVDTEGLLKDLFAGEAGEGSDQLVAKIEMPTKGGGMKLWT